MFRTYWRNRKHDAVWATDFRKSVEESIRICEQMQWPIRASHQSDLLKSILEQIDRNPLDVRQYADVLRRIPDINRLELLTSRLATMFDENDYHGRLKATTHYGKLLAALHAGLVRSHRFSRYISRWYHNPVLSALFHLVGADWLDCELDDHRNWVYVYRGGISVVNGKKVNTSALLTSVWCVIAFTMGYLLK